MATKNTMRAIGIIGSVLALQAHAHGMEGEPWSIFDPIEPNGVEIGGQWIGEYSSIVSGGVDRNGGFRDLITIDVELDLGELIGFERTTVFGQLLHANPGEDGGVRDSGDLQTFSNIEIDRSLSAVYELWIEHVFEELNLRVKAGKVDANSEFDVVDSLGGFSHSSAGFSPTLFAFPSYPDPSFSINMFWSPSESVTIGYGLYDGALGADGVLTGGRGPSTFFDDDRSNDWFHIAQVDTSWDHYHGGGLSVGGWYHSGEFEGFDGVNHDSTSGFFATLHQTLWVDPGSDRSIELGVQYGNSDPGLSEVEHHLGIGCVAHGVFAHRSEDEAGIYMSWAGLSDEPGAGFDGDELAIDVYYALGLHSNVTIRPEIQWISNPSGDPGVDDALVLGMRVELSF